MGRKTSIVWNHFTIPVLYPKKALCNYCHQLVCRGQTNLGTTSLMNHLKRCNDFRATALGLPKGINEMMAEVISGAGETPQPGRTHGIYLEDATPESHSISDEEISSHATAILKDDNTLHSSTGPMQFLSHKVCNSPSLVGRQSWTPSTKKAVKGYQNNGRPSMLLYGDISSTSEEEEPSSSNMCEPDTSSIASPADNLANYMACNSTVNFVHGGFMQHILYQQYKTGKFCDLHIIPQKATNEATISETGKILHKNSPSEKRDNKISVHTCLLTAMSRKINTLVEMGCTSVQLKKGGSDAVKGLIEIIYTGKLEKIRLYSETDLMEILEVARFLEVDLAVQYLMREIPETKPRSKQAAHRELFHERMLMALPHLKRPMQIPQMPSLVNSTSVLNAMRNHEIPWSAAYVNAHSNELHKNKKQKLSSLNTERPSIPSSESEFRTGQNNLNNEMIRQRLIARLLPKSCNVDESVTEFYDDDEFLEEEIQMNPKLEYFPDIVENQQMVDHENRESEQS